MVDISQYFGKKQSLALAGVSVLLMIWHHLFFFPKWYIEDFDIYFITGSKIGSYLTFFPAAFGNMCVPVFAFISGYALYITSGVKHNSLILRGGKKLFNFLISYWLVECLFIIYGLLLNETLPTSTQFLSNMLGLQTKPGNEWINVPFAWYVSFYIVFIILSPLFLKVYKDQGWKSDILFTLLVVLLIYFGLSNPFEGNLKELFFNLYPFFAISCGILAAKYNFFGYSKRFLKKIPFFILMILIVSLMVFRSKFFIYFKFNEINGMFISSILGGALSLIFISLVLEILYRYRNSVFERILVFIGSLAMYLWFLHGLLFTGTGLLQPFIFNFKEPLLIYFVVLIIMIPIAYIIKILSNNLLIFLDNIFFILGIFNKKGSKKETN